MTATDAAAARPLQSLLPVRTGTLCACACTHVPCMTLCAMCRRRSRLTQVGVDLITRVGMRRSPARVCGRCACDAHNSLRKTKRLSVLRNGQHDRPSITRTLIPSSTTVNKPSIVRYSELWRSLIDSHSITREVLPALQPPCRMKLPISLESP